MNILLWVLQILVAFMYGASGVMKIFKAYTREMMPTIMSGVLGVVMVFIAYGRMVLQPIA